MSEPHQYPSGQPGQDSAQPGQPYAQPGQPYAQPGQPYAQPGQPGQHYAQSSGYPGAPSPAASPTHAGGSLGRVSFIIALASLAIGLLITIGTPVLLRAADFTASSYGAILGVGNLLVLIVAIVALVLGLIAVRRPGRQILAGIAIGIAGSEIVAILVSWVSNLALTLTYS